MTTPKPLWKVYETVDDRGTHGDLVGIFDSEDIAADEAEGMGWYGGPGRIVPCWGLYFGDRVFYYIMEEPDPVMVGTNFLRDAERKKKAALAKLTPAEKRLLGLEE